MRDFRKFKIWQESHAFVKDLYKIAEEFPSSEKYLISNQIFRASVSIACNIADSLIKKLKVNQL
jgi:four helix bundle protein